MPAMTEPKLIAGNANRPLANAIARRMSMHRGMNVAPIEARVERFQVKVRELLRTVEEDPRDLTAARKFMSIYLQGARDATVKFADIYARDRDRAARSDYMMLLTDLEESFNAKTKSLLLDDRSDLTVEIEVLRDRLGREGIRLKS